jgi:hypothetical protein
VDLLLMGLCMEQAEEKAEDTPMVKEEKLLQGTR